MQTLLVAVTESNTYVCVVESASMPDWIEGALKAVETPCHERFKEGHRRVERLFQWIFRQPEVDPLSIIMGENGHGRFVELRALNVARVVVVAPDY